MPKTKSQKKKAKAKKKAKPVVVVIARRLPGGHKHLTNEPDPWIASLFLPALGPTKIPDLRSNPTGVAQSYLVNSAAAISSTSWDFVAGYQLSPRSGVTGAYRRINSIAADVITWTGWSPMPNSLALQAACGQNRQTAACLMGSIIGIPLTSATGILYAAVGTQTSVGQATTAISVLTSLPRLCSTGLTTGKVAKAIFGFNCPNDYDFYQTNFGTGGATDGDADVLTVFATGLPAGTASINSYHLINWETLASDRASTVLATTPARIDLRALERGLRSIATYGQVFICDEFDLGSGIPVSTPAAQLMQYGQSAENMGETVSSESPLNQVNGRSASVSSYLSQAESASQQIGNIVGNSARAAGLVAGALAVNRAMVAAGR